MGNFTKAQIAIAVLAIVYGVGLVGFLTMPQQFQGLTPLNLLLAAFLVGLFHRRWSAGFVVAALLVGISGFAVEWLGVETGKIFGVYRYGDSLGPKLWDIPLMIGVNWLLLVYCSSATMQFTTLPWWAKGALAAGIMVALDYLIEPFAIKYGLWQWQGDVVPLQNYAAWYAVALLMQLPFQYFKFPEPNKVAIALLLIQTIFFGALLIAG